ncbi:MAG: InlB B-repeat-containing protein [Eubacterium sp.]|nr:InlB B-repeat-containing protein [Eubacterium sp.]
MVNAMMFRRIRKNKKGFTLAETLIAIAIIGIVSAIAFGGAAARQKDSELMELDSAARSVFVAAQNHAAASRASGVWNRFVKDALESGSAGTALGTPMEIMPSDAPEGMTLDNMYSVRVGRDTPEGSIVSLLLPYGAIDESLRTNNNIVIEYNASNGAVYAVWYAKNGPAVTSNTGRGTSSEAKNVRKNSDPMMGYYGGAAAADEEEEEGEIKYFSVSIRNAETLELHICDYNTDYKEGEGLKAVLTGVTSGASQELDMTPADSELSFTKYEYLLDSVTGEGEHFRELFNTTYEGTFIPGEDIKVTVTVEKGKKKVTKEHTDNSLFESVTGNKASVGNGRHLQNLASSVSGLNENTVNPVIRSAVMTRDILWSGTSGAVTARPFLDGEERTAVYDLNGNAYTGQFLSVSNAALSAFDGNYKTIANLNIRANADQAAGLIGEAETEEMTIRNVQLADPSISADGDPVYAGTLLGNGGTSDLTVEGCRVDFTGAADLQTGASYAGTAVGHAGTGSFISISSLTVTGSSGLSVQGAGQTGGVIGAAGGSNSSLNLDNVSVSVGGGSALNVTGGRATGGLIGEIAAGKTAVIDSASATGGGSGDLVLETSSEQSACAGGLIGSVNGGAVTVRNCYATTYVRGVSGAGGLIGSFRAGSGSKIVNSYAGGRTARDAEKDNNSTYIESADAGVQGRWNVISDYASLGQAGGFIGYVSSGVSIANCYSTASAYNSGAGAAGGFIGQVDGSVSVSDCYCTGRVSSGDEESAGCFIGLNGGAAEQNTFYLAGINSGIEASGSRSQTKSSAEKTEDGTEGTPFAKGASPAYIYNANIEEAAYPYTVVNGGAHYGDWPYPGEEGETTFVVRKKMFHRYYDDFGQNEYRDVPFEQNETTQINPSKIKVYVYSYTDDKTDLQPVYDKDGNRVEGELSHQTAHSKEWECRFEDLPEKDESGKTLHYVGREVNTDGQPVMQDGGFYNDLHYGTFLVQYDDSEEPTEEGEVICTISNILEGVRIRGEIEWIDLDAGKRPASVTLQLYKGNAYVSGTKMTVSGTGSIWTYSFKDKKNNDIYYPLRDDAGNIVNYEVRESVVDGYIRSVSPKEGDPFFQYITNRVCYYVYYYTGEGTGKVLTTQEYSLVPDGQGGYTYPLLSTKGVIYRPGNERVVSHWNYKSGGQTIEYPYNMDLQPEAQNYVTKDMNLTAYIETAHTITYNTMVPGVYVESQVYLPAETTRAPQSPSFEGLIFEGWYTEQECRNPFTFGSTISQDITLYAKWSSDSKAAYRVILWAESASDVRLTDAAGNDLPFERTFDYYESHQITPDKSTVSIFESVDRFVEEGGISQYLRACPEGFYYAGWNSRNTVFRADGTTVINVYFNRCNFDIAFHNIPTTVIEPEQVTAKKGAFDSNYYIKTIYKITNESGKAYNSTYGYLYTDESLNTILPYSSLSNNLKCYIKTQKTISYTDVYHGLYNQAFSTYGYKWKGDYEWRYSESIFGGTLTSLFMFCSDEAVKNNDTYTLNLYYWKKMNTDTDLYFYREDPDNLGTYELSDTVPVDWGWFGTFFTFSEKYNGYTISQYSKSDTSTPGTWYPARDGETIGIGKNLHLRYSVRKYELTFDSQILSGDQYLRKTEVPFEKTMSEYSGTEPMLGQDTIEQYAAKHGMSSAVRTTAGDSWYLDRESTIKASWLSTLYLNGRSFGSAVQYYDGGNLFMTIVTCGDGSRVFIDGSGKMFKGWFKDMAGEQPFDFEGTMPLGNVVSYGYWQIPRVWISFDLQGGSAPAGISASIYDPQDITVNSTDELMRPVPDPVREGYDFAGWIDENGRPANFGAKFAADATFYADWISTTEAYSITYDANGGNAAAPTDTARYLQNAKIRLLDYGGRKGKAEFIGWNTEADGSGQAYYPGLTYTMGTEDLKLYAQFGEG